MGSNREKHPYEQNYPYESFTTSPTSQPKLTKQQQQQHIKQQEQQHRPNEKRETTRDTLDRENYHEQQSANENPKENAISSHLENFRQQRSDFAWLTAPSKKFLGSDHFHNSVVSSTFPASLNRDDFEYYIDMTFSDFPEYIRIRMKALYNKNDLNSSSEDLIFDSHADGTLSAILVQILTQKNEYDELEMIAGLVSVTRKPSVDHHYVADDWQNKRSKVQRALQYIFGNEAQKEIAHR